MIICFCCSPITTSKFADLESLHYCKILDLYILKQAVLRPTCHRDKGDFLLQFLNTSKYQSERIE